MEYLHEALDRAWRVSLSLAPWVVVVIGFARLFRARPAVVHLATLGLAMAHGLPFVLPLRRDVVELGPGFGSSGAGPIALPFDRHPLPWFAVLAVGLCLVGGRWILAARARRRIGRWQPASTEVVALVERLCADLGVRRKPRVSWCSDHQGPFVQEGWGGPRVWIPEARWATWSPEDRELVLLHELAHLRRRDGIAHGIWSVLTPLYWWNPLLHWLQRASEEKAELACDRWATSLRTEGRDAYARALLELAWSRSRAMGIPGEAMVGRTRRRLEERIRAVFHEDRPPTSRAAPWVALLVLGLASCLITGQIGAFEKRHLIEGPSELRAFLAGEADPSARRAAVDAVGNTLGASDRALGGILVKAFGNEESPSVRYEILDALDRLLAFGAFEGFLREAQQDPSPRVQRRARELLDRIPG